MGFVHLHVHTQYSILDGAAPIKKLFAAADADGQVALAITDHGNMYGVKEFFKHAKSFPNVKPIIGEEFYVSPNNDRFLRDNPEERRPHHLILLAKNKNGYKNLVKLSSYAFIEGNYQRPKIDRKVLEQYHEDLICSSACLAGEIPRAIYAQDIDKAREAIEWYHNLFGDDFYLEVQRHPTQVPNADKKVFMMQQVVNEKIFELAEEYGIKTIATNDVHFVKAEDAVAHDHLICLTFNNDYDDPDRVHYTQQVYLKSQEEMAELFKDHPESVSNTLEIVDKIETYKIDSDPILPKFELPREFTDEIDTYLDKYKDIIDAGRCDKKGNDRGVEFTWSVAYLCELTYRGARMRYGDTLNEEQSQRIEFELKTICMMGFPDYFLIVSDFIQASRDMGTWVGPGRGSAAGSVVAYCLHITNIDPLKYDLLFERFLNPDRISMPDIDIDFDDDGRGEVYHYVERKYGKDHISHVVTFGTMATKGALKDIARIRKVDLAVSNSLTKMVPERDWEDEQKDEDGNKLEPKKVKVSIKECLKRVPEFKEAYDNGGELLQQTIDYAAELEGSIRQTGVHACATIIGRDDLTNFIPLCTVKDKDGKTDLLVSQYAGSYIEDVGMLKMDFLGLSTLSIQKECLKNIKLTHGIDIDIEAIPIDDKKTYELFGRGDTVAVFQFESEGMQKWLRDLQPDKFEDLIAMNALYRPGPMDFIPTYVRRKHGEEKIVYDLAPMEGILKDTYGVTVYQEQVMLLSRALANFTRGEADTLRKAMGKKKLDVLMGLKEKFMEGGKANGHPEETLDMIWKQWYKFASYAFNKSHATCYAWVAYQTAYLKAHYPAEFYAANMSRNLNDIKEITKLMDDCRKAKIQVLGPDVNESLTAFSVNHDGNIRFGMAGVKGVGSNVVDEIIRLREKGGPFTDFFNFIERVPNNVINRKVLECLVNSGALDCFTEATRSQYFALTSKGEPFIDAVISYANKYHNDTLSSANSLFGDMVEMKPIRPDFPFVAEENNLEVLKREKDVVGMYLSAHPLDIYSFEIEQFTTGNLTKLKEVADSIDTDAAMVHSGKAKIQNTCLNAQMTVVGLVTKYDGGTTKTGRPFCKFTVEDFDGSYTFSLFGKDYEQFMPYTKEGTPLLINCGVTKRFAPKDSTEPPRYEMRIKEMHLLSNLKDSMIQEFHVTLPITILTPGFRKEFAKVCHKCKGKARLYARVYDDKEKLDVEFFSRKYKVSPDQELLDFLKEHGIKYHI
ncbi:MAG: DNA polymerase III subunit alpha [Bacteroidales bacterium]|nr:DNA polymerase III subunit alpha [Candidatus Equibacterium intestinale]